MLAPGVFRRCDAVFGFLVAALVSRALLVRVGGSARGVAPQLLDLRAQVASLHPQAPERFQHVRVNRGLQGLELLPQVRKLAPLCKRLVVKRLDAESAQACPAIRLRAVRARCSAVLGDIADHATEFCEPLVQAAIRGVDFRLEVHGRCLHEVQKGCVEVGLQGVDLLTDLRPYPCWRRWRPGTRRLHRSGRHLGCRDGANSWYVKGHPAVARVATSVGGCDSCTNGCADWHSRADALASHVGAKALLNTGWDLRAALGRRGIEPHGQAGRG
mmetsp:Transcript_46067/g.128029  ORF Transcript_46067/g.128029 Transcript_46067/m.128029 type:complete len:272 (+) Transcript_46067:1181-1996(+)